MVIRIESLTVEDLQCFRGEHQLDFGRRDEPTIDTVVGSNGVGKTALADSIRLCLTGKFEDETSSINHKLIDDLSLGEKVSAEVSVVIADSKLGQRFRFTRKFHTSKTRRGPVNFVDSLQTEEEKNGDWVSTSSSKAINTVFPLPAFTFSQVESDASVGVESSGYGISWSDFVGAVGEAAAKQSAARGLDLPEYFSNDYDLGDEIVSRINDLLPKLDKRDLYTLEVRQDGLVPRRKTTGQPVPSELGNAGTRILISHAAALVAGEVMPVTPPLIGDTMFGRMDRENRERVFEVIKQSDRQILLFALDAELEGSDVSPRFKLEQSNEDRESKIIAVD